MDKLMIPYFYLQKVLIYILFLMLKIVFGF
jgi:hypothetical protein